MEYVKAFFTVEILTIAALLLGPLLAVCVGRNLDDRRLKRERRMDVFRSLMRTRRDNLSFDHVSALNLLEVEFQSDRKVIDAWKDYLDYLCQDHGRTHDEKLSDDMSEPERQIRDERRDSRIMVERQELLIKLLRVMAQTLDHEVEVPSIFKSGYSPRGWAEIENQQAITRQFVVDLYYGRRGLPVCPIDPLGETKPPDLMKS